MLHALRCRRVITPEGERDAVVVIDGETIRAVIAPGELPSDIPCQDLGDWALLPGLVDVHTHINEPGRTEWEGFATGTRAAAAGGFTTIVDMPLNCLPETINVAALTAKRQAAEGQALVDYALWGGAVDGNQAEISSLAAAGVAGYKCFLIYPGCEGFTSIDYGNLRAALPEIARTGLPLLVHAELAAPIEDATAKLHAEGADWRRYATYLASRPDAAEVEAITMLLDLCREFRFRLHIVHVASAQALPLLAAAEREGLPVTAETCPHYLHIAAETIPDGATQFKCAPPLRSEANREALWGGLLDGTLDLIATDHSPCPPEMKSAAGGRFDRAWGGIASLSTALPVVWGECVRRGIPLERLAQWMSTAPAGLAGIANKVGAVAPGMHADLVAFDTESIAEVTTARLHYRHPTSPYLGEQLRGVVRGTWLRGERVFYLDGNTAVFAAKPSGKEQVRGPAVSDELQAWNRVSLHEAVGAVLPCNGSPAWARAVALQRPYVTAEALFATADDAWRALPLSDWQQAFDSHPRIGQTHAKAAAAQSLAWSEGEQSALSPEEDTCARLAEGNRAYEDRFGRIFLVCATGKSAAEMLAILERRLLNDPGTELLEAAEQQRRITQLRLRKWLGLPPASCDSV